ncbi:hypothetical protein MU0083_003859 [[Mycobacterium] kokjensenii]|uniref:Carbohydrate kinase PfkB domain-containing protein n=1 Tax=[Mycobacterium] kokjensenii TaxID=3064287 RepID=A0ABN9NKE2_9MYCO|nr:hypothetical protein [Mycolicibacter sp. MU0083]CAJ1506094.1 hypothetical protein MU0083_003859 [Mycolicibacter sp. MU0083]
MSSTVSVDLVAIGRNLLAEVRIPQTDAGRGGLDPIVRAAGFGRAVVGGSGSRLNTVRAGPCQPTSTRSHHLN